MKNEKIWHDFKEVAPKKRGRYVVSAGPCSPELECSYNPWTNTFQYVSFAFGEKGLIIRANRDGIMWRDLNDEECE